MNKIKLPLVALMSFLLSFNMLNAQENTENKPEGYKFSDEIRLKYTPPKNQFRSSTCWSYSTVGMLESELIRLGKGEYDLSEAFIVYHTYSEKSSDYVRWNGALNFGPGGACHDVVLMMKKYGIVPDEIYNGLVIDEEYFVHSEMDNVLKGYVDGIVKNPNKKLTPVWHKGLEGVLDSYLGKLPQDFAYNGKKYTPTTFSESLGLKYDDYKSFTSFTHHPFYESFILEVPDNWMLQKSYNVPLNDFEKIVDEALKNGYTVAWAADVSEKGFSWKNGVAVVPDEKNPDLSGTDRDHWEKLSAKEKTEGLYKFDKPLKEKEITQGIRQQEFDNYLTTDDHGLQIIGTAKDQNDAKYYIVKNSWGGINDHIYNGFMYVSASYFRCKTLSITVNINAISKTTLKDIKWQ